MKKHSWILLGLILVLATSCGIKQEEYDRVKKELANREATLQTSQQELAKCKEGADGCQKELDKIRHDFNALGEDFNALGKEHSQIAKEKNALGENYKEVQSQLQKLLKANELRQKAMDDLLSKFSELIKSGKLTIGINDGRMVIQLPSNVLFGVGQANLSKDGKEALTAVADVMRTIPDRKFQVAGHTDNQRGPGKVNTNWSLAYNRARAVFDLLVKAGVDESFLSLAAYAEYSPVASNDTPEGQESNRRIEIVLLPTSDELPLKQLKKIEKIEKINVEEKK